MKKSEGKDNRKLIIFLSILLVAIAVLVVAIVVVHNMTATMNKALTQEELEEHSEETSVAYNDCEEMNKAFRSGLISEDMFEQYYNELYEKNESSFYRVRLTLCYTDYKYNIDGNVEEAVSRLEKIEPLIRAGDDLFDYYNRLIVYYIDADDWEKASYYAELRDQSFSVGESVDESAALNEEGYVDEELEQSNMDKEEENE